MKDTVYIINTARGPIIDEEALIVALKEGKIAGCGLGCYGNEPPSFSSLFFFNISLNGWWDIGFECFN